MKVVHFVMNLRTNNKAFFLSRHGQSEYNEAGRIGGDSGLSQHGINYAKKLAEFVGDYITHSKQVQQQKEGKDNSDEKFVEEVPVRLWTSTLKRTKETGQFLPQNKIILK